MSTDGPDMFDGHIQTLVLYSGTDPVMVFLDGDLVITEHKTKAKLLPTWKTSCDPSWPTSQTWPAITVARGWRGGLTHSKPCRSPSG